jgi:hypothetical protein
MSLQHSAPCTRMPYFSLRHSRAKGIWKVPGSHFIPEVTDKCLLIYGLFDRYFGNCEQEVLRRTNRILSLRRYRLRRKQRFQQLYCCVCSLSRERLYRAVALHR